MRRLLFLLVFASASLLQAAELVDRIVAIVGTEVITLSDLQAAPRSGKKDPLNGLIREKILKIETERTGIEVTSDDLARGIAEVLRRNRISIDQLKEEMARQGKTFEQYKEELRREIRRMKFMGQVIVPRIRVSEEEIQKGLGKNPTEEDRLLARQKIVESRLSQELDNYLDEARAKTYVEIKK